MTDLEYALIEWKAAREAFWAVPPVPTGQRFPRETWDRLGRAESRLMELAEKVSP